MGDKDDGIGTTTANVLGTTTASRSSVQHMFRRPRSHICPPFIGPTSERSSDQSTKLFVVGFPARYDKCGMGMDSATSQPPIFGHVLTRRKREIFSFLFSFFLLLLRALQLLLNGTNDVFTA